MNEVKKVYARRDRVYIVTSNQKFEFETSGPETAKAIAKKCRNVIDVRHSGEMIEFINRLIID